MRFKYAALALQKPSQDMTPMIDIIFNLLLFFILSSSYVQHSSMEVKLPEAASGQQFEGEAVVVELTRDDLILFQGKAVSLDELKVKMKEAYANPEVNKPLLVRADAQAFHGKVIAILDIARESGVKALNVATIPPPKAAPTPARARSR